VWVSVLDRCAGAKKNYNDLWSASSVHLRVAAMTPESLSCAYFLRWEAQPAAGFDMSA
jgi:hypothetical protein